MIRTGTKKDLNRVTRVMIRSLELKYFEERKLRDFIDKAHRMGTCNGEVIYSLNNTEATINAWLIIRRGEEK